jgi:hypothetical protein
MAAPRESAISAAYSSYIKATPGFTALLFCPLIYALHVGEAVIWRLGDGASLFLRKGERR